MVRPGGPGGRPGAAPGGGRGFGGGWMGMGQPVERSKDFGGTLQQLLGRLRPEWPRIAFVAVLASTSVAFTVIGPRIIGDATNVIFNGVVGKRLPEGVSKAEAIAALRAHGQGQIAQMLSGMDVTPGRGI